MTITGGLFFKKTRVKNSRVSGRPYHLAAEFYDLILILKKRV
jgi:hypothetical protein